MRPDLGSLQIHRLIIHKMPRHLRRDTSSAPNYSEVESPLDDQLRSFFREKVIETAGSSSAFGVAFDDGSTSPVPRLVKDSIARINADFVTISEEIARHLHDSQGGVNPGGLVTIMECHIDSTIALAILKLEREEGVRLDSIEYKGKHTFDVRYIQDLILTRKTKLFKIGQCLSLT